MQIRYEFNQNTFNLLPSFCFNYWITKSMITVFKIGKSISTLFDVKKGADTGDNEKYLREWFEIKQNDFSEFSTSKTWVPYVKGGDFRRRYGNKEYVVYWKNDGYDLKHSKANLRSPQLYFNKTITWSAISSGLSSFRYNDALGLFDSAGSSMKPQDNIFNYVLCMMNSKVATTILMNLNPTLNYGAGTVGTFPMILSDNPTIDNYSIQNRTISKEDWDSFETSWGFKKHPLI